MTYPTGSHVQGGSTFGVLDPSGEAGTEVLPAGYIARPEGLLLDGTLRRVQVAPVISAGAIYASGDAVGGLMTFANVFESAELGGTLETVVVMDRDQEMAALDLVLFDAAPAGTADNAAFDPTDAELLTCLGVVEIRSYANFADNCVATVRGVGLAVKAAATTSLFGQLVVRGTPTYTATSDIAVTLAVRSN